MATVFVSHSHLDDTFGQQLIGDLKRRLGESAVWYDASGGLHGGDEWWRTIVAAITSHDIFLVILTPAALASDWVTREMEVAYYQHVKQGKRLLPVLLQPCALPTHWELLHSLNFTDSARYQPNLNLLLAEIARATPAASRPSPAATTNVPTLVVDQMHRGDHTTIGAAIAAARPGTRILVHPGLYREGLIIDKPLEVVGDGDRDDIIVEASGKYVINFQTTAGRVANLTLRQTGGDKWYAVAIAQGRLELEDCDITSQSLACVGIHDGAYARVRHNRIHDGKAGGVYAYEQGQGVIEDNEIFGNTLAGIEIKTGSNPTVRHNRIYEGKSGGIFVQDQGQGVIEDNEIFGNALAGIEIKTGGNPTVHKNLINDGKQGGIKVHDQGQGLIEDNELFGNTLSDIVIMTGGNPTVRRNHIHDSKQSGVFVTEQGQGVIEDNEIFSNTYAGIEIRTGGNPTVRCNHITHNGYQGIRVYDGGKGVFTDNDLRGNTRGAWDIAADCEPNVQRSNNQE